jgi:hypothetical protein
MVVVGCLKKNKKKRGGVDVFCCDPLNSVPYPVLHFTPCSVKKKNVYI